MRHTSSIAFGRSGSKAKTRVKRPGNRLRRERLSFECLEPRCLLDGNPAVMWILTEGFSTTPGNSYGRALYGLRDDGQGGLVELYKPAGLPAGSVFYSPRVNGNQVVFHAGTNLSHPDRGNIYLGTLGSDTVTHLTNFGYRDTPAGSVVWLPSGSGVLFSNIGTGISKMDLNPATNDETLLTTNYFDEVQGTRSSEPSIFFENSMYRLPNRAFTMTTSGANVAGHDPFGDGSTDTPVLSPDGTKVALLRRGHNGLWLADANTWSLITPVGSPLITEELNYNGAGDGMIAWSSDSQSIAYVKGGQLWSVPISGGAPRQVTTGSFGDLRVWGSMTTADTTPPQVDSLTPAPGAMLQSAPPTIVATFSEEVSSPTITAQTFRLVRSGGDGTFDDGNEVIINAASVSRTDATHATMDLTSVPLPDDTYQVTLVGDTTAPQRITDLAGNILDGDENDLAGGNYQSTFSLACLIQGEIDFWNRAGEPITDKTILPNKVHVTIWQDQVGQDYQWPPDPIPVFQTDAVPKDSLPSKAFFTVPYATLVVGQEYTIDVSVFYGVDYNVSEYGTDHKRIRFHWTGDKMTLAPVRLTYEDVRQSEYVTADPTLALGVWCKRTGKNITFRFGEGEFTDQEKWAVREALLTWANTDLVDFALTSADNADIVFRKYRKTLRLAAATPTTPWTRWTVEFSKENWSTNSELIYDVEGRWQAPDGGNLLTTTALHEIGHVLGLCYYPEQNNPDKLNQQWSIMDYGGSGYSGHVLWPGWSDVAALRLINDKSLVVRSHCPVDLVLTDDSGNVVSKTLNQITGATYTETDLDGDGDLDDQITIPNPSTQGYSITVVPEPGADPNAPVTLVVEDHSVKRILLDNVRVADLPTSPIVLDVDRTPPELTVDPTPAVLGPADTWVPVHVNVQVEDETDPNPQVALVGVQPSWEVDPATVIQGADYGQDDRDFELLASSNAEPRYYTITYATTDTTGNVTYATSTVYVGSNLNGRVYLDANYDDTDDNAEPGIPGVTVTLGGVDCLGNPVGLVAQTDEDGCFDFPAILPGTYALTETQPEGYSDGTDWPGSLGGDADNDVVGQIQVGSGQTGTGYRFGELPPPTPPEIKTVSVSSVRIVEYGSITLTGVFVDPNLPDTHTVLIDWGDGTDITTLNLAAGVTDIPQTVHQYVNNLPGNAPYTISVTVADEEEASAASTAQVTVDNVAPSCSISGSASGVPGQPLTFTITAADPSSVDQAAGFAYRIDWGDGSAPQTIPQAPGNGDGLQTTHAYTRLGRFTARVTATDNDGGVSQICPTMTTINSTVIAPAFGDPAALLIGGTAGNDVIFVVGLGLSGDVGVLINGRVQGIVAGRKFGTIGIYGGTGNDFLYVASNVRRNAFLFGEDGNDRLCGGGGNNVLVGGQGNDFLLGGTRRNLLIGGAGRDILNAAAGDSVLIGGTTDYDSSDAALAALLAEWSRTNATYQQRVAHLTGAVAGGLNGSFSLNAATVANDVTVDLLLGGPGSDLFFASRGDLLAAGQRSERILWY